jgi:hypothetical protein
MTWDKQHPYRPLTRTSPPQKGDHGRRRERFPGGEPAASDSLPDRNEDGTMELKPPGLLLGTRRR